MKRIFNNQGVALVWVLIVMTVLAIIGFSLSSVSIAEAKHAILSEQTKQAHYAAKLGAEGAAKYLIANRKTDSVEDLYTVETPVELFNDEIANGTVATSVRGVSGDDDLLLVFSQGVVNGKQENVNLTLKRGIASPWFGEFGITAKTDVLGIGGAYQVNAHVAAGTGDADDISVESGYSYLYGDALPPNFAESFPEVDAWKDHLGNEIDDIDATTIGAINLHGSDAEVVSYSLDNIVIIDGDIDLGGGSSLTFTADEDPDSKLYIKVKGDITTSGTTNLIFDGAGTIYLYVEGSINLQGTFENNIPGGADRLIMFVPQGVPERTIEMGGTTDYDAHIIAPDVDMTSGGNPTFSGMVIVNSFAGNGDFTFNQYPDFPYDIFGGTLEWPLQITVYSK